MVTQLIVVFTDSDSTLFYKLKVTQLRILLTESPSTNSFFMESHSVFFYDPKIT